jgi:HEAT repeat protein
MMRCLDSDDLELAMEAANYLAGMDSKEVIPALLRRMKTIREDGKMTILGALARLGAPEGLRLAREALHSNLQDHRQSALQLLAELHDRESIPAFVAALKDPSEWVRSAAVDALGMLRARDAIPQILPLLQDVESIVSTKAFDALERLAAVDAVPAVRKLLKDPSEDIRRDAACAAGRLGDRDAVPALRALVKDPSPGVRTCAIRALADLGAIEAAPDLRALLESDSPEERGQAAIALGRLGIRDAAARLARMLRDEDDKVCLAAAHALENLDAREFIPELEKLAARDESVLRILLTLGSAAARREFENAVGTTGFEVNAIRRPDVWKRLTGRWYVRRAGDSKRQMLERVAETAGLPLRWTPRAKTLFDPTSWMSQWYSPAAFGDPFALDGRNDLRLPLLDALEGVRLGRRALRCPGGRCDRRDGPGGDPADVEGLVGRPEEGAAMKIPAALFALLVLAQSEEFQKRVRMDGTRIFVDDKVLYEGPWKNASVNVVDFTGKRARQTFREHEPWKQIVLSIDGEERLRIPVQSLTKPIAWPPVRLDEVQPAIKKLTETVGAKKTFVALVSSDKADFEIYRGPEYETRAERTAASFTVTLNGDVLYRVSRAAKPPPRVEDVVMAINLQRVKAGVGVTRPAPALSKACDLHALYLTKNEPRGLSGHEEDPKGVGYTEEGARAGKRSVISPFSPHDSPVDAIDSLLATLYHRVALLHPAVGEIGVGWANRKDGLGFVVIDVGGGDARPDAKLYPIVYPRERSGGRPARVRSRGPGESESDSGRRHRRRLSHHHPDSGASRQGMRRRGATAHRRNGRGLLDLHPRLARAQGLAPARRDLPDPQREAQTGGPLHRAVQGPALGSRKGVEFLHEEVANDHEDRPVPGSASAPARVPDPSLGGGRVGLHPDGPARDRNLLPSDPPQDRADRQPQLRDRSIETDGSRTAHLPNGRMPCAWPAADSFTLATSAAVLFTE